MTKAGQVRGKTPKVAKTSKGKKKFGRAGQRLKFNKRFGKGSAPKRDVFKAAK